MKTYDKVPYIYHPVSQKDDSPSWLRSFVDAFLVVASGTIAFFVVYYGWLLVVEPIVHKLLNIFP